MAARQRIANLTAAIALCTGIGLHAQTPAPTSAESLPAFLKSHYTRRDIRIPMRDGVKLYTEVFTPVAGAFADKGPFPFLMTRTPYSCGNYDKADVVAPRVTGNEAMLHSGYIIVCQDVRGRYMSEGAWLEMTPSRDGKGIDESTDTYDTVEYLLKNVPANNGRVGILGISYPGFYTAASIIDGHPAIKAASPQAPMSDLFMGDDSYHGGAFMLSANHDFYTNFAPQKNPTAGDTGPHWEFPVHDTYQYYLGVGTLSSLDTAANGTNPLFHDQAAHNTYDDYWKARNISTHMHGVKAATLEVGGLFDAEDIVGPVKIFHAIDAQSPGTPANTLVEGPWVHGGWSRSTGASLGDVQFASDTAKFYRDTIEAPFFEHYLKNGPDPALPKAYVFTTGSNQWHKFSAWPPREARPRSLYLAAGGALTLVAPTAAKSSDSYVADPAHPVPFTGYVTDNVPQRYMADDQRFAATRPDVLVYQTAPLTEDITIAGPVRPRLFVASTGTDADFVVKLIDVYPEDFKNPEAAQGKRVTGAQPVVMGGYQQLVRGEPFRAKYRNSWEKPEPLVPGKTAELHYALPDVSHTFLKGHRIMVQVQSSWFPLVDRNPQTFVDTYKAHPEDFHAATQTVFHQQSAPSHLELTVLP